MAFFKVTRMFYSFFLPFLQPESREADREPGCMSHRNPQGKEGIWMKVLATQAVEPSFLQVVAMGLITVFVVLICLIIIIKIMGALIGGRASSTPAAPAPAPAPAAPAPAAAAPQAAANKQQLVAAISAAIAEEMGSGVEHIKIHSIRRL